MMENKETLRLLLKNLKIDEGLFKHIIPKMIHFNANTTLMMFVALHMEKVNS